MSGFLGKFTYVRTYVRTCGRTYVRTNAIAMDPAGTRGSKNQKKIMSRSLEKTVNVRTDGRTYGRTNAIAMDPSGTRGSKNQKNPMKRLEDIAEKHYWVNCIKFVPVPSVTYFCFFIQYEMKLDAFSLFAWLYKFMCT